MFTLNRAFGNGHRGKINVSCGHRFLISKYSKKSAEKTTLSDEVVADKRQTSNVTAKSWQREIHLLGPKDPRFPLPGETGISAFDLKRTKTQEFSTKLVPYDLARLEVTSERFLDAFNHFLPETETSDVLLKKALNGASFIFESFECPTLIRNDFYALSPLKHFSHALTVITFHEDTNSNDEVKPDWDPFEVMGDRLCVKLKELGYWAQFLSSGDLSSLNNLTVVSMEARKRFRDFVLRIEENGACTSIKYEKSELRSFGMVFSNIPTHSPHLKALLDTLN